MNQFRYKQLKSMVVPGCKTLADGFFTGAVQKKHLLPSGHRTWESMGERVL
jgi:hypothetical protein